VEADPDDAFAPGEASRQAIAALSLTAEHVLELPPLEAAVIRDSVERKFLTPGNDWWWERLNSGTSFWFSDRRWGGHIAIPYLCPDTPAWFFPVYNDEGEVFSGRPTAIAKILEHTRDNEYALADVNLNWLLIENHHSVIFGSGEPIVSRLSEWLQRAGCGGGALEPRKGST